MAAPVFSAAALWACLLPALAQDSNGLRPRLDPNRQERTNSPPEEAEPVADERRAQPRSDLFTPIDDTAPSASDRTAPNYGRPRRLPDKRRAYKGRRGELRRSLPPLEPYATAPANVRASFRAGRQPPVQYAQPRQILRKARPKVEHNPYAPLGINMGSIRVLPFVEVSGGYDTNANRSSAMPSGSGFARFDAGFTAISLWPRHEFRADVRGGYYKFFSNSDADRPDGSARFNLRLDATKTTRLDIEMRGTLTTQRPGSPELNSSVVGRPIVASFGATAGVTKTIGRVEASLSGLVDRTAYKDGRLSNGNNLRLSQDNFNAYGLRGRVAYEVTPGIKPFAEVTVDTRRRDEAIDLNGFARNSDGLAARLGSSFELSRIFTGEASAGYARRTYTDPRLTSISGLTVDASLIWTATPLTNIRFRAQTLLNETTVANAAGYISRRGSIEINHALLRNLNLGATAMWQNNDYRGIALTENLFEGTLKAEYSLTHSVVIKGSYTHARLKSSQPGADYTANVFLLGLRLQR